MYKNLMWEQIDSNQGVPCHVLYCDGRRVCSLLGDSGQWLWTPALKVGGHTTVLRADDLDAAKLMAVECVRFAVKQTLDYADHLLHALE